MLSLGALSSAYSICSVAAGVAGNAFAFVLFVSQILTFKRIIRSQSTEQISGFPYICALLNCLICLWYGTPIISTGIILVFTINTIGSVFHRVYGTIFIVYAEGTKKLKSVEYMPFYLSLTTFLMSLSFFVYGLFQHDLFITVPNGIGAALEVISLVLYFCYSGRSHELLHHRTGKKTDLSLMASTSRSNQLQIGSSSSAKSRSEYDVFMSFRGEDTRRNFTDHLYSALDRSGVHTFKDDEALRKGNYFPTELIKAIERSKISIVVISKNYANSRWCLDELVKILECKEMLNQVVLPIFYLVDPSDVRKKIGDFGDAFTRYTEQFSADKIDEWKAALTKISSFIGWHLKDVGDRYESEYIDAVVEVVQQEVNYTYLDVAKHPVGINVRVSKVVSLLQSGANNDVRVVGIYGMGGVGKTTLAKAIYNKIYRMFQGSCFLADVKSNGSDHLDRLQEKLLRETLRTKKFEVWNVHQGIRLVRERLGLKKILVVLDDVDHITQLEALVREPDWFGPGSIIIITTRDFHLLNCLGIDEKYKVHGLWHHESLQLFSLHAFRNRVPLEAYAELSNMIVRYAGGLPLALTVLGSHFRGRNSIQEWREDFKKLRRIPHKDILKILKISYDALDDDAQRIFLDIACFFVGRFEKEEIVMALNGCGYCVESGIRTLVDRCLCSNDLSMHGLVHDMGREIVRQESPTQPEKRSRVFLADDVLDVLKNKKGTEAIEVIFADFGMQTNVHLDTEIFSRMTRLRLLKIRSFHFRGSLRHFPNELRLLSWHNCSLRRISSDLRLEKLVTLDMSCSEIEEFQPDLQNFGCLKELRLNRCMQLKSISGFTGAHSLRKVSLFGCENLVELPESIGDLRNLVELNITHCSNVRKLPSSISKLTSLEDLSLNCYSKIKEWPPNFENLKQLRFLHAMGTCLLLLPFSCMGMRNLEDLSLGSNERLLVTEASSAVLELRDPFNYCHLPMLRYLYLENCQTPRVLQFPLSLKLEILCLGNCQNLQVLQLPRSLKLQALSLEYCQKLQVLQELPPKLMFLFLKNCFLLERLLGLSELKDLTKLEISDCSNLVELQGLENLVSIEHINIIECNALTIHPWIMNFKARPHGCVRMTLSEDMGVCKVVRCSSNYTLEEKARLIIRVSVDKFDSNMIFSLKCKTTAVELLRGEHFLYWDRYVRFIYTGYDHFENPVRVEELEACIELDRLGGRVTEDIGDRISGYIVYEDGKEEDGELLHFPLNVEIKSLED